MFGSFGVDLERPVPIEPKKVTGWKEVPIAEIGELLVPVGPFTEYPFAKDAVYAGETKTSPYTKKSPFKGGLEGSLYTPFMREGLARKLRKAQSLLPEGHVFLIWDAYRPLQVQASLFDYYMHVLLSEYSDWSQDQLLTEAQRFVSLPSTDPTKPSPHNTGGAVDLTIVRLPVPTWRNLENRIKKALTKKDPNWYKMFRDADYERQVLVRSHGELLDMGTPFDYVGPETETNYYEKLNPWRLTPDQRVVLLNRRLLFNSLRSVGIENYEEEWWHYCRGDQMWGRKTNKLAFYGAATFSEQNAKVEDEMRHFYQYFLSKSNAGVPGHIWEDPRQTRHPMTAQI